MLTSQPPKTYSLSIIAQVAVIRKLLFSACYQSGIDKPAHSSTLGQFRDSSRNSLSTMSVQASQCLILGFLGWH